MTAVTLTNSISGTYTFDDGEVDNVSSSISSMPDADPMPAGAPTDVIIVDQNGSKKTISISGKLYGTSVATVLTKKQNLEKFINGFQSALTTFGSNYESQSYNGSAFVSTVGIVTRITFTENTGTPLLLDFTLDFVVGS